jgi:hypothetical protein
MNLYKQLLRLYPKAFYRRFGHDIAADFDDGYEVARRSGSVAVASFVGRCYGDLFGSLLSQWLRNESLIVGGMAVAVALGMWAAAFYVARHEWPNAPVTSLFLWQVSPTEPAERR